MYHTNKCQRDSECSAEPGKTRLFSIHPRRRCCAIQGGRKCEKTLEFWVRKKEIRRFSVRSFINLGRLWWNLIHSFLNKFVAKSYKRFSPHPNNASTLPCEIQNAYRTRATVELLHKETLEFSSPPCGPKIHQIWIQLVTACEVTARKSVQNAHHWSGCNETATNSKTDVTDQTGSLRHCGSHFLVVSSSSVKANGGHFDWAPSLTFVIVRLLLVMVSLLQMLTTRTVMRQLQTVCCDVVIERLYSHFARQSSRTD